MKPSATTHLPQNALFRQFRAAFEGLTGLPLDVLAPGEFRIPDGAPDFCGIMGLTPQSCEACHDAHARLQGSKEGGTRTEECFAGMTSSSVPLKVRGETLAFLHTGHVFVGKAGKRNWKNLKRFIARHNLDPEACERALQAARSTDPGQYQSAIRLLEIFAKQLSETLSPGPIGETYPAIEQAMRMIRQDLEQDWTLTRVARAVKMNPSYFSDVFRKSTGQTFSSYLAALRIERACRMLEATERGIGEIAFSSGFRSISQFNRSFKKVTDLSPGQFREQQKSTPAAA
ncbi:MAG: helix-turn-helix domain-containing protein [Terrimicrobiaceae bacterium]